MSLSLPRRDFLRGLLAVAAPAIVSAANITPVRAIVGLEGVWNTNAIYGWIDVRCLELRDSLLPGLTTLRNRYNKLPLIDWAEEA